MTTADKANYKFTRCAMCGKHTARKRHKNGKYYCRDCEPNNEVDELKKIMGIDK